MFILDKKADDMVHGKEFSFFSHLSDDLKAECMARGGISKLRVALFATGFHLCVLIRLQFLLTKLPYLGTFLARLVFLFTSMFRNCEIDPLTIIGPGVRFPHPIGIVIAQVNIGKSVVIMQNCTIGARKDVNSLIAASQTIGNNTVIGAGAHLIGNLTIGDNVTIGANSVVISDVPSNHVAVGIPARCRLPTGN